ncbi:hypothetical protein K474DRAFT_1773760 [Panus rudis PR-1116 ss-1]|nr:hypothetical protein K474DRAFT_1773760 [Panus rudis PR-1116 ss-1]
MQTLQSTQGPPDALTLFDDARISSLLCRPEALDVSKASIWYDEEIERGLAYLGTLSLRRNNIVPAINRILPNELLANIFELTVGDLVDAAKRPKNLRFPALILSSVCRRWRAIMLHDPACWATIHLGYPGYANLCMSRVSGNGLHMYFKTPEYTPRRNRCDCGLPGCIAGYSDSEDSDGDEETFVPYLTSKFMEQLVPKAAQFTSIELEGALDQFFPRIARELYPLTGLQRLELRNTDEEDLLNLDLGDINNGLPCPNLRSVTLVDVRFPWNSPLFSRLTSLNVEYMSNPFGEVDLFAEVLTFSRLQDILEHCPGLEELTLKYLPFERNPRAAFSRTVTLPKLRRFTFYEENNLIPAALVELFSHISYPPSTRVELQYSTFPKSVAGVLSHLIKGEAMKGVARMVKSLEVRVSEEETIIVGWLEAYHDKAHRTPTITEAHLSICFQNRYSMRSRTTPPDALDTLARVTFLFRSPRIKTLTLEESGLRPVQGQGQGEGQDGQVQTQGEDLLPYWRALATAVARYKSVKRLGIKSSALMHPFFPLLREALSSSNPEGQTEGNQTNSEEQRVKLTQLTLGGRLVRSYPQSQEDFEVFRKEVVALARAVSLDVLRIHDCVPLAYAHPAFLVNEKLASLTKDLLPTKFLYPKVRTLDFSSILD